jgi:hypothetical protein
MCLALAGASVWAQVSKPGTGTVTGHVICRDTQQPARFAQVGVLSVPTAVTTVPKFDGSDPKTIQAYGKAMNDAMNHSTFMMAQTGMDGSFAVEDVAPGDYYVMASVGGYIEPRELLQAAHDAGEDLTKSVSGLPMVRVSAGHSVDAEISVTRGAAIEGRVLWDDGSGVNQAAVAVEPKAGDHKPLPPQFTMFYMGGGLSAANTDDRGHYRISGLAPGEYIVRAMLQTNRRMTVQRGQFDQNMNVGVGPLMVYAPAGFRKVDAKPVTLTAGEERTDVDITYNLGATHTVSGRVTSAEDHHGLNRGVVTLTDTSEKTFTRTSGLDADGNFTVTFVPSGTYTMTVRNAADAAPEEPKSEDAGIPSIVGVKIVRTYEKAEQPVMVTDSDLSGQNIELKPEKVQNADPGDSDDQEHVVVGTGH